MMSRVHALAVLGIFILVSLSWFGLGGTMMARSISQGDALSSRVGDLWGYPQEQQAPELVLLWSTKTQKQEVIHDSETDTSETRTRWVIERHQRHLDPSQARVAVDLVLDERRKGLVWFPLYEVGFDGMYRLEEVDLSDLPPDAEDVHLEVQVRLPHGGATFDDFRLWVDDADVSAKSERTEGSFRFSKPVSHGDALSLAFGYRSRGVRVWTYEPLPESVRPGLVEDFELTLATDFRAIDFPAGSMSPSEKKKVDGGWRLVWDFERILTSQSIGMVMPERIQPGELGAKLSASAPISLGFFSIVLFAFCVLHGVRIHPIHYAFISAAFFSFHLLFSYTADHLAVEWAFALASLTSVALVVSYMRLVVSSGFAFGPVAVAQLVYMVSFGVAHFFVGFTGLAITVLGIATLFWLMQATGRIDWYGEPDVAGKAEGSPA